jgi:hypothetical protein
LDPHKHLQNHCWGRKALFLEGRAATAWSMELTTDIHPLLKVWQDCKRCHLWRSTIPLHSHFWLSRCGTLSLYTCKCSSSYAQKKVTASPSLIFTKLTNTQQNYVRISDTEFHLYCKNNMESAGTNLLWSLRSNGFHCAYFCAICNNEIKFWGHLLYRVFCPNTMKNTEYRAKISFKHLIWLSLQRVPRNSQLCSVITLRSLILNFIRFGGKSGRNSFTL